MTSRYASRITESSNTRQQAHQAVVQVAAEAAPGSGALCDAVSMLLRSCLVRSFERRPDMIACAKTSKSKYTSMGAKMSVPSCVYCRWVAFESTTALSAAMALHKLTLQVSLSLRDGNDLLFGKLAHVRFDRVSV